METVISQSSTMIQFISLLVLAFIFWGVPSILYGKFKVLYIDHPFAHIIWHGLGVFIIILSFKTRVAEYFSEISQVHISALLVITLLWMLVPILYKRFQTEYLTTKERIAYQPTKYSEIVLQQMVVLGGLLILDWNWFMFGLVFFSLHVVAVLFLPKKAFWSTAPASLLGGFSFAFLQSLGVAGFLASFSLHLSFYAILQSGIIPKFKCYKR
ncbi:MAG: hypothetical protein NUV53_01510 [Patescibacteria group bacterium]|nr:hypothetical protein [Patescibacteria group bacterium]